MKVSKGPSLLVTHISQILSCLTLTFALFNLVYYDFSDCVHHVMSTPLHTIWIHCIQVDIIIFFWFFNSTSISDWQKLNSLAQYLTSILHSSWLLLVSHKSLYQLFSKPFMALFLFAYFGIFYINLIKPKRQYF